MLNFTPFLRAYAQYRKTKLSSQNIAQTQEQQLLSLVSYARNTIFGKQHDFSKIQSVSDFQARVPLRTYDQFWNEFLKPSFPKIDNVVWPGLIPFYAVSSGTSSGTTKYIPYTHQMTRSNAKGGLDLLTHHLNNRPQSKIFAGNNFILGGSTELVQQCPGVQSGDLSGIAVLTLPWWAKQRYFPPPHLALLKNWEEKIDVLAKNSLQAQIRMISGVPSWMLILIKKLSELVPHSHGKLSAIYPNLDLLVHGGVNFSPYKKTFDDLLEGSHAELREVYPASEGFIAVADRGYGDGLRMVLDSGIFYEFVPLEELNSQNPTRHWIKTVQPDINYAIVLSTCAGLWSYILGDTVRFVDTKFPRVLVTGRTSYYLSAFGEHLIEEEIQDAVSTAASAVTMNINDFSVGPLYPQSKSEIGGHIYVIEFADDKQPLALRSSRLSEFATVLDKRLCQRNEDYEAHRAKGFGLRAPEILAVKPGTFASWMKHRGKLGGQNKVPRIITKQELLDDLLSYCRNGNTLENK